MLVPRPDSRQCNESHELISDTIEDEGPFDGVIGFSQGAAVAVSMLLHHEIHNRGKPPPFKFGIFFCSIPVISPDPNYISEEIQKFLPYIRDYRQRRPASGGDGTAAGTEDMVPTVKEASKQRTGPKSRALLILKSQKEALVAELCDLFYDMLKMAPGKVEAERNGWSGAIDTTKPEHFPRFMHPLTTKSRISIPTVHVIGNSDMYAYQSELAVRVCEKKMTKVINVAADHAMPIAVSDLRAIASAAEWAIQKSRHL